jgi:hypothetical protein
MKSSFVFLLLSVFSAGQEVQPPESTQSLIAILRKDPLNAVAIGSLAKRDDPEGNSSGGLSFLEKRRRG